MRNNNYEFGCVLIHLTFENWKEIHKNINPSDLYEPQNSHYGLQTTPHLTLLYGLDKGVTEDEVFGILKKFDLKELEIEVDGIDNFENESFDVLKLNVTKCQLLENIHNSLKELPNSDKYTNYNPHITIAFLKIGTSRKYTQSNIKFSINNINMITYCKQNGEEIQLKFR